MTPGNGWRKFIGGAISGGLIAFTISAAIGLLALGAERDRVLIHVATDDPHHQSDTEAHLSTIEATVIARLPVQFEDMQRRLSAIEATNAEILREIRRR